MLLWILLLGLGMPNGRLLPFLGQPRFVDKDKDLRKRQEINVYNQSKVVVIKRILDAVSLLFNNNVSLSFAKNISVAPQFRPKKCYKWT